MYRFNSLLAALVLTLALVSWSKSAQAKLIDNLYTGLVDVSSQSQQHRQEAIGAAFDRVIVKVTGQRSLLEHPAIKSARREVNQYLVQYGYQRSGSQSQLQATFDGQKLRQLLAENELPYWGSRRPQLLLWIAQEQDSGRRQLIGSSNESIFTQQLRSYAEQLAIPIQLPLLDLTDSMQVSVTDVWGRFIGPVATASQRYVADGFVIARITERPLAEDPEQKYQLDWRIDVESKRLTGVVYASSMDWLAEPFVNDMLNKLAQQFSVTNSNQQAQIEVPLMVENLTSWQDVLALEAFLASIPSVVSTQLQRYSSEQAQLLVVVRGNEDNLLQSIQLDGRLVTQDIGPFVVPQAEQQTVYRWKDD